MPALADLNRTVAAVLAEQRSVPVFVRYTAVASADAALVKLAQMATAVRAWLGQSPEQVHALGRAGAGALSVTLVFHEGATALLGVVRKLPAGAALDLMILGNHGAIYHQAGAGDLWDADTADPSAPDTAVRNAIERSLASGIPESVEGGAGQ